VQARDEAVALWHVQAHTEAGIDLPWSYNEAWQNMNVYTDEGEIDRDATLDRLAAVLAYASRVDGATVTKSYSHDFELSIEVEREGQPKFTVRYYGDRESVCTKRVVGIKTVPEKITPAREEEIVEWECEPVSLLARNKQISS